MSSSISEFITPDSAITPEEKSSGPDCPPPKKRPCARILEDESLKSPTAIHLEKIAQAFISAINARNFDTSTYPYKENISSAFVGDLERPPGFPDMGLKGLEEQMRMYEFVTSIYPDYSVRIFDLNTYVDEKAGKAMMYFNGETVGLGEGVKMPSLGTLEFQRYGSQWKCLCFRGVRGMVDGCVGARYEV